MITAHVRCQALADMTGKIHIVRELHDPGRIIRTNSVTLSQEYSIERERSEAIY